MLAETMVAEHPKRAPAMTSGGGMGGVDYRSAKTSSTGPSPALSSPARGTVDRSASIGAALPKAK